MRVAEAFFQQAESLNAAADAAQRLARGQGELIQQQDALLRQRQQATRLAANDGPVLLRPDGRPVTPTTPPPAPLPPPEGPRPPTRTFPTTGTRSTGGGGAGGSGLTSGAGVSGGAPATGAGGRGRLLRSRRGDFKAESWVAAHCTRTTERVLNPKNRWAIRDNDFIEVPAWDCREALNDTEAIFLDPDALEAARGFRRLSSSSSGGGAGGMTGGQGHERISPTNTRPFETGGGGLTTTFTGGGSTAPAAPDGGVGLLVARGLSEVTNELRGLRRDQATALARQDGVGRQLVREMSELTNQGRGAERDRGRGGVDLRKAGLA